MRIGDTIINLDNAITIDLNWAPDDEEGTEPLVAIEFLLRGWDELEEGDNVAYPYLKTFEGEEAEAIRKYLKTKVPDLLEE